ncbi:hypothetical protein DFR56_11511 [Pseudogracilibacillus auburnensis]|uniref:Uncharacterized protein n=1 Tax=Pseudogracilibacillus auburnensis TaxID=1494959 RepID=A0A2V3VNW0_9BACI|nr:hypothetical protein DFR56_11511 [Pseudogracilibacillus auburnensis]
MSINNTIGQIYDLPAPEINSEDSCRIENFI